MSIVDTLHDLWHKQATHYVIARIPQERTEPRVAAEPIRAEKHYVRLWLSEMFLADDTKLFKTFAPVVHSSIRLTYGTTTTEFPYVAGPQNLNIGTTLGRGVQLDHRLTNLLPFRGGSLDVSAALVAYRDRDYFTGLVNVLHNVSKILNVGQVSAALKVISGVTDGIQGLLGNGDKEVHLTFYQGYGGTTGSGGNTLESGYTALVRADARHFDANDLSVVGTRLHFGKGPKRRPLDGVDYMLLRVERADERDDYLSFEELSSLLQEAIRAGSQDRKKGDEIIGSAVAVAWQSADLTNTDRVRAVRALKTEYETALGGVAASGRGASPEGVRSFADAIGKMTPAEAARLARFNRLTSESAASEVLAALENAEVTSRRESARRNPARKRQRRHK